MQIPAQTTSTSAPVSLPYHHRHSVIQFQSDDGNLGEVAYPINYTEVYNLKGRLLTLVDATFTDPQQRKAQKDLVWHTLKSWFEDLEATAGEPPFKAYVPDGGQNGDPA